jgi:hypothetical protein
MVPYGNPKGEGTAGSLGLVCEAARAPARQRASSSALKHLPPNSMRIPRLVNELHETGTSLIAALLMDQLAVHEDAIRLGAKACKQEGARMFNDNVVRRAMSHSERVAAHCLGGEMREGRQWAPFRHDLAIRQNAQRAGHRISVDLDPRRRTDLDGKSHGRRFLGCAGMPL